MPKNPSKESSKPSRAHFEEAGRLLHACSAGSDTAVAAGLAVGQVCRKLTDHLEPLITRSGAQALLARSVYLSKPRFGVLATISTAESATDVARDLPPCLQELPAHEALQAAQDVLQNFVWLLTRFIGDELGLRLLREACPDPMRSNDEPT